MAVTKQDLTYALSDATGLTGRDSMALVNMFFDTIHSR
ncbi:MAG: HU family DNA-binding protein [Acidithiobacillus sp.]